MAIGKTLDLRELVVFDGGEHLVLSCYLNLTPDRQIRRTYRIVFEDLVARLRAQADQENREALDQEVARVQSFLETEPPRGKGLALFSCTPRQFWDVHYLPVIVAERVDYRRRPTVAPLLDALDEYERYAVALVDKKKARLFIVYLGAIEEQDKFSDFTPGHHDQGGLSQANFQRHHEAHVYRHLKRVVEDLSVLQQRRPFDRLVLAGPEEVTTELERILPRSLRTRLVAKIPGEIDANEKLILERTLAVEREAERQTEECLVDTILNLALAGGRAVRLVAPTLEAIGRGSVHQLVVSDGLRLAGSECPSCGRLAVDRPSSCPVCGARPDALEDLVERAIERTLEEDGLVENVHDRAARCLNEQADGMAALLRF